MTCQKRTCFSGGFDGFERREGDPAVIKSLDPAFERAQQLDLPLKTGGRVHLLCPLS